MKRLGIIGVLALLIAALVFLNRGMSRNAGPAQGDDDDQQHAQSQAAPKPAPVSAAETLKGDQPPPEETVGDPAHAKHHIQVGWAYDNANQPNPAALSERLSAIRQVVQESHGAVSAEIVNVDVPASDRSPAAQTVNGLGVTVDGKTAIAGNPSAPSLTPGQIIASLKGMTP